MTVRIRVCTTIDAPPARVWNVVEKIEHHTQWMTDAARITFVTSITRGVGTLGLDPNKCGTPSIIIIADHIALYPQELYHKGLEIVTVSVPPFFSDRLRDNRMRPGFFRCSKTKHTNTWSKVPGP